MGSQGEEAPTDRQEEITVLVTGFGPFRAQYPINPSWEIAKSLPPFLPPPSESSLVNHLPASILSSLPAVRLLVYPSPVHVGYEAVRELVPTLWRGRKIDYCIHIGMASGRRFYSIERRAHRDGYLMKDVDNQFLGDGERRKEEGDKWIWHGLPAELLSDIDVDDVWKRWRFALPEVDVRISEDAGRYLCDFIYYSSFAYLTKHQEERRVLFLHVPVDASDRAIETGIDTTIELIRSIVISGQMTKLIKTQQEAALSEKVNSQIPILTEESIAH